MNKIEIHQDQIEVVSIDKLTKRPNNRNFHKQTQIDNLAEIYKFQGFRNPIIVSKRSGWIVCGHGRYLAAIRAGMKEVPVIYQDYSSDDQEYAHHVADNAVALQAELDLSGIQADIPNLSVDFDLDMLGIKNFVLDVSGSGFDPSDTVESDKEQKRCPHCGEEL
jgi:hypothetical protein